MQKDKPSQWLHPNTGLTTSRRHLPHLELEGSYYFTTTTTKFRRVLTPDERAIVLSAIRFMDGKKYDLDAAVVMPDHFHTILQPLGKSSEGVYSLREIFHSIKSFSANKIGGVVWQDENFDHLIRDEKDYSEKLNYTLWNPVKAEIVSEPWEYPFLYWVGRAGSTDLRGTDLRG